MAHPDILVEVDEQEGTRWLSYNGNHYPFEDSGRELHVETQDPHHLKYGLCSGYEPNNEEYNAFKARQHYQEQQQ